MPSFSCHPWCAIIRQQRLTISKTRLLRSSCTPSTRCSRRWPPSRQETRERRRSMPMEREAPQRKFSRLGHGAHVMACIAKPCRIVAPDMCFDISLSKYPVIRETFPVVRFYETYEAREYSTDFGELAVWKRIHPKEFRIKILAEGLARFCSPSRGGWRIYLLSIHLLARLRWREDGPACRDPIDSIDVLG